MGWGKPNQTHREAGGRVGVKAARGSREREVQWAREGVAAA